MAEQQLFRPEGLEERSELIAIVEPPKWAGHKTARKAVDLLVAKGIGFHNPTKTERDALLVGFAMKRKVLYGAATTLSGSMRQST